MFEPQKYRINLELMQYKPKFWECIRALCVLFICSEYVSNYYSYLIQISTEYIYTAFVVL